MKRTDEIAKASLFNGLPAAQLEELARISLEQNYEKGVELFSEGSRAHGFYMVSEGKIKIFKLSLEGKEQILHIFSSGEIFGEAPVFGGGNYPANAEAIEPSRVFFFPRVDFIALIQREPSIALNMLGILSRRLRQFTNLIEDLSLKEVPARLAAYLLYLGERSGSTETVELDITKAQLASLLGTIPETLSRILTRMAQQGIISVDGRKIRLLDIKILESLASGGKGQI